VRDNACGKLIRFYTLFTDETHAILCGYSLLLASVTKQRYPDLQGYPDLLGYPDVLGYPDPRPPHG